MARLRYKGTDTVRIPALSQTVVAPNEIVEVPDVLVWVEGAENPPTALVWSEDLWSVVEEPKSPTKAPPRGPAEPAAPATADGSNLDKE